MVDIALNIADEYFFDDFYTRFFPPVSMNVTSSFEDNTFFQHHSFPRDNIYRQFLSLNIITNFFAYFFYFFFASLSYFFVFDKELMNHPKFLKNQIRKELTLSVTGFPITT